MGLIRLSGVALAALSLVGYVLGVVVPYPGRELSITAFMTGVTLTAVGTTGEGSA